MTEEDLVAIERLVKQRVYVQLPTEEWSAGMTKAMLDKIPELVAEVRRRTKEREILVATIEMNLETFKMDSMNWAKNILDKVKA